MSPAILKAHAVSSLGGLSAVLRSVAKSPGAKTILFLSAGLVTANTPAEVSAVLDDAARAQARIFALQVPTPTDPYRDAGERDLRALAQETGGALVPLPSKPEQALERLAGQLSFSYLLMLAPMAGDTDAGAARARRHAPPPLRSRHPVAEAHHLWPRDGGRDRLVALAARRRGGPAGTGRQATGGAAPARPGHRAAARLVRPRPGAQPVHRARRRLRVGVRQGAVVGRLRGNLHAGGERARAPLPNRTVVLDGRVLAPAGAGSKTTRTLVSDYLQVKVPNLEGWLPFRDVFEVDGQQVRDRQDRLTKLFLESPPERALENAQAIVRESARYNIGTVRRDVNLPTLALWFLEGANTRRFNFRKAGEDTLSGRRVWVVEYTEIIHPTIIKTPDGADIVASGRIWAEPTTGRVHRTLLTASIASITVNYASRPEVPGLWLPVTMEEQYAHGATLIKGKATYAKFRQFQVQTSEQIVLPKK